MGYSYSYNYDMALEDALNNFAAMGSVHSLVTSVLGIAVYVFTALALYTIAKRRGISKAWLAWIPVLDVWVLGSISDQFRYVVKGEVKAKRKILLTLSLISAVLSIVVVVLAVVVIVSVFVGAIEQVSGDRMLQQIMGSVFGVLGVSLVMLCVGIARMIVYYMALYDLYTSCEPDSNVLYLVLSIVPGVSAVALPLLLFLCREKDGGMPPRRPEPVYDAYTQPVYEAYTQPEEPCWNTEPTQENEPWNNVEE